MDTLTIIYFFSGLALAFFAGAALETFIDAKTISDLKEQNRDLQKDNEELRRLLDNKVEIYEIKDNRTQPDNYFTPF